MSADPLDFQFVDTNIFVYAHDRSAGYKHSVAKALIQDLWESQRGCLSIQVLQEFYVNVTQKIPKPLDRAEAQQLISDLAFWKVHTPEVKDILDAIEIQQNYPLSFWDAMIIQSAVRSGSNRIWSEDLNSDQVYAGVMVINPFKGD